MYTWIVIAVFTIPVVGIIYIVTLLIPIFPFRAIPDNDDNRSWLRKMEDELKG